jgi:hypothetical protein
MIIVRSLEGVSRPVSVLSIDVEREGGREDKESSVSKGVLGVLGVVPLLGILMNFALSLRNGTIAGWGD